MSGVSVAMDIGMMAMKMVTLRVAAMGLGLVAKGLDVPQCPLMML